MSYIITHKKNGPMELSQIDEKYSWLVSGDYVSEFTTKSRAELAIRGSIEAVKAYCKEKGIKPFSWSNEAYYRVMELR